MPPPPAACLPELRKPGDPGALGWRQAPAHLLHQRFLVAHLLFTSDAPRSAGSLLPGCEHAAPGVSGFLVGSRVESDVSLNSGSEALGLAEGFGQS